MNCLNCKEECTQQYSSITPEDEEPQYSCEKCCFKEEKTNL
jgi:hypothetical protein